MPLGKGETEKELKYEISDFLYHAMVLMVEQHGKIS